MESNIQRLRSLYSELRKAAFNNDTKGFTAQKVKTGKKVCNAELNSIQENGDYSNYEEVDFYKEKFSAIAKLMNEANQTKSFTKKTYFSEMQNILKQEKFVIPNSQLKSQTKPVEVSQGPPPENMVISAFFQNKKSKISPETGFKSVLQNMPVTNKSFRKKSTKKIIPAESADGGSSRNIEEKEENLARLIRQNQNLKQRLQEEKKRLSKIVDSEDEIKSLEDKIQTLALQNQKLSTENSRLRTEKSVTVYTHRQSSYSQPEEPYQPYTFQTRQNDLYKLNVKNEGEHSQQAQQFDDRDQIEPIQETMSENGRIATFSSFSMTQSYYSQRGSNELSRLGIEDKRVVSKNKVAYFKNSFLISKDNDFEIGYKRSDLEGNHDKMKLIFYVNNKTAEQRPVQIKYDYERDYYDIDIREKIVNVQAFGQSREVLEITLRSMTDLNSIIESVFIIGEKRYNLWVPALFIQLQSPREEDYDSGKIKKTIIVNKHFGSNQLLKIFPTKIKMLSENEGHFWGVSKLHSGPIKLRWKPNNKLQVETSHLWMDLITYILYDYQHEK